MTLTVQSRRLHDWQLRLEAFVRARQSQPFAWGSNDCCMFAAGAVEAITGEDPAAAFRGSYATAREAAGTLEAHGGVVALAVAALGSSVSPLRAAVGDIVLIEVAGREALGLCNGTSVLGPSATGLRAYGMGAALAAWKVGHA